MEDTEEIKIQIDLPEQAMLVSSLDSVSEIEVQAIVNASLDGEISESAQDAIDTELDALHAKLKATLSLTDREINMLGIEPPAVRKDRKDQRALKSNNKPTVVKVAKP